MKRLRSLCLCGCLLITSTAQNLPKASKRQTQEARSSHQGFKPTELVKVGLLLPAIETEDWRAAKRGAEMAIAAANKNGGYNGRPFQLVVRSLNGPWASGSKEIVGIVLDENVRAIVSWLDGRSAHLAEQIVTKTQVALISTRATDPTLTQINIPWFFRCVPDDRQQGEILVREIIQVRRLKRLAVLTEDTSDARTAADVFMKVVASAGLPSPLLLTYSELKADSRVLFKEMKQDEIDGVVLFGQPAAATDFVRLMRKQGMKHAIFGPMNLLNSDFTLSDPYALAGAVLIAPGHLMSSRGKVFQKAYLNAYGCRPGAAAAYAYDGIGVIVEAIRLGGLNRERIRDALENINYRQSITGQIRFDARGKRQGPFHLIEILKGRPSFIEL